MRAAGDLPAALCCPCRTERGGAAARGAVLFPFLIVLVAERLECAPNVAKHVCFGMGGANGQKPAKPDQILR